LALGDVGKFDGRWFVGRSSLAEKKVPFEVLPDASSDPLNCFLSADAVHPKLKLAGKAELFAPTIPIGDAGVVLEFTRSGAVAYYAHDTRWDRIADIDALEPKLKALHDNHAWNLNEIVVTHVMTASRCTIVVASEAGANIELKVSAGFKVEPLSDADLSAGFEFVNGHGIAVKIIAENVTPLYRAMRLQRFGGHLVSPRAPGGHFGALAGEGFQPGVDGGSTDQIDLDELGDNVAVSEEREEDEKEGPNDLQWTEVTW
jgi:hypothetical protein